MFIRIKDNDTICYAQEPNIIGCNSFLQDNNRYHTNVTSFTIDTHGQIVFSSQELKTKKIPPKHKEDFFNFTYKTIVTDNDDTLLFQDPCNSVNLLTYNFGNFYKVNFDKITEDDDIVTFDENAQEWAISGIKEIKVWQINQQDPDPESNSISFELYKYLSGNMSDHILNIDYGIIINNIFII